MAALDGVLVIVASVTPQLEVYRCGLRDRLIMKKSNSASLNLTI